MRGLRAIAVFVLTVLVLIPAPALAFGGTVHDGQVVFGEDFTLPAGEVLDGDLVVFGGDVTLETESQVNGNVVIWGGQVEVDGTIRGDLAVFGGDVHLAESAVVEGNLATMGGQVRREEGAQVRGQEVTAPQGVWSFPVVIPFTGFSRTVPIPGGPQFWRDSLSRLAFRVFFKGVRLVLMVLLMAGLSGLAVVLWPKPAIRVGKTVVEAPLPSLGVGLLTTVVAVIVVLGLAVTICLSPVALLAALAAGVAAVFGWTSLGVIVGERVLAGLTSRTVNPFWSAALGGALITLLSGLLDLIPCVGWMGGFLVAAIGMGAVVLTRFGTMDYPLASPAA